MLSPCEEARHVAAEEKAELQEPLSPVATATVVGDVPSMRIPKPTEVPIEQDWPSITVAKGAKSSDSDLLIGRESVGVS